MVETKSIIVRAVKIENSYKGSYRLEATRSGFRAPTKISSICAEFETDEQFNLREDIDFKKLFFYGNEADVNSNSRVRSEADATVIKSLVEQHLERIYASQNGKIFSKGPGLARIALEDLELDQKATILLREVFDSYAPILRSLSRRMKRVNLPTKEDKNRLKSAMSQFMRFPGNLGELALPIGYYYSFTYRKYC